MTTAEAFTRKYTSEEARAIKEVGYGLHSTTPETAKKYLNAGGILALQWNHSNSMYYSEHDETYVPVCVLKLVAFNIEDDTATVNTTFVTRLTFLKLIPMYCYSVQRLTPKTLNRTRR